MRSCFSSKKNIENFSRISLKKFSSKSLRQTYNQTGLAGQIISYNYQFSNQLRNITLFRAYDLAVNGTGGFASILAGGIGHRNVTFNLRASAVGRGYVFFVDIYGV
jgi:hypothetical protein